MDKMEPAIVIQGASRGIGLEFVKQALERRPRRRVVATCRDPERADALRTLEAQHAGRLIVLPLDVTAEDTIHAAARRLTEETDRLELLVNVAGVLHGPGVSPEKKLGHVQPEALRAVFEINAFGPLLVAKHFHPFFRHDARSVFASLSARVGSISDNRLGGWYAYRASKAAQNMITKNLSIELGRLAPHAIVVGLHPGTVATDLSAPFRRNVPPERLFTPTRSVGSLLDVIEGLQPEDTGRVFDFRGDEVPP